MAALTNRRLLAATLALAALASSLSAALFLAQHRRAWRGVALERRVEVLAAEVERLSVEVRELRAERELAAR